MRRPKKRGKRIDAVAQRMGENYLAMLYVFDFIAALVARERIAHAKQRWPVGSGNVDDRLARYLKQVPSVEALRSDPEHAAEVEREVRQFLSGAARSIVNAIPSEWADSLARTEFAGAYRATAGAAVSKLDQFPPPSTGELAFDSATKIRREVGTSLGLSRNTVIKLERETGVREVADRRSPPGNSRRAPRSGDRRQRRQ